MNLNPEPAWKSPFASAGPGAHSLPGAVAATGAANNPKPVPHLQLAWGHKFALLGFMLLGALAGTAYVVIRIPMYSAAATVEVVGFNQSFMGMSQVDPQAGTDGTTTSTSNITTQMKILTSRSLLSRAVDRMNLELTPVTLPSTTPQGEVSLSQRVSLFFTGLHNRIPFFQQEPIELSREALKKAVKTVSANMVTAKGGGITRLIDVECLSTSPDVGANFVNTLISEHIAQSGNARSNVTQRTSQWMDSQLEEARSRLQQANEKLSDFVQKSGMDFFPEQNTLADSKLRSLQSDLSAIQADRIAKQARWELAKSTPFDSLPDVMGDQTLQGLKGQIINLRGQMAELTATLTPQHYKVQRIQAQITQAEQELEKAKSALLERTQSEYQEALRQEKLLAAAYTGQTHSVSAQADKASQYAMLKRDVDTEQQLYNNLLQQSTQAALVALAPTSNIRVVDAATPGAIPAVPYPVRDIPLSAVLGILLGYGLLWMREAARSKRRTLLFDTPGHSRTVLGVPELGVIPSVQIDQPSMALIAKASMRLKPILGMLGASTENGAPKSAESQWESDRSSMLSESFRQTLVSLLRTRPSDHTPMYVITSSAPGEGKTTLSSNLARALAEVGHRVLLVDADLRRPSLHSLLKLPDQEGLSDILAESSPLQKIDLSRYIQSTEINNLSVMSHGQTQTETPALLFFSPRITEFVSLLQSRFDFVLLDTAPALPFPDARLWGRHADGIILVVRAGVTTREGATAACERFHDDGIPVLGTVLNDWTPADNSQFSYYYYKNYKSAPAK